MKTKLPKLPHHKSNYHPLNNNDWMPQHCLPQNHDDYSFTPLQLSHSSSLSTSSSSSSGCNHSESVSLPLPPSRLVRHSHIYPVPWSDAVTTTNNNDSKYDKNGGDPIVGGRASSPSSVAGFPPPFEFKRRRRRADDCEEEGIGMRMEGLLTVCGGTDTSVVEGDGRMMNEAPGVELFNQSYYHGGGGREGDKLHHRKELLQDKNSGGQEEDVCQLSSGMEFLTMITCGLLNTTTTATDATSK